jgi:pimeloyl-ACP methyl ester carboxylesterase
MLTNIRLPDATIALDDVGEGSPILLLHGFPATRRLWSQVAPLLVNSGLRVLIPDLVGYGESEPASGVRVDMVSQALWMLQVLDALGIARAAVVAHDVGSAAARRLFPVLVRRLSKDGALRETLAAYESEQGGLRLIRAARDLDPSQTANIGEALRASKVPALVLWGERDVFLPRSTVAQPLADLLQAALVILPGGHFTPVDCPVEVAAALCNFLVRLSP